MGGTQFYFTAKKGQTVEVMTLPLTQSAHPKQVGYVVDEGEDDVTPIEVMTSDDVTRTMTSRSNEVTVSILDGDHQPFIVFVKALGCEDLTLPKEFTEMMWIAREGDATAIGCKHAEKTWNLKCVGVDWRGVVGNCSGGPPLKLEAVMYQETSQLALPKDVILMTIVGATLVGAVIIITVAYVLYKRSLPVDDIEKPEQDYMRPIYKKPLEQFPPPLPEKRGSTLFRKNPLQGTMVKPTNYQAPPQPPPMRQNNQLQETVPLRNLAPENNSKVLRNSEVVVEDYENYEAPQKTG
ncbi:hypothetical protein CAPTEDRAFT_222892 [Capitella teleta]|uniref:Uncharacterized protein n=1 Tax=Capitella teleta TaxID=283909 RepID=R7U9E5_CAPTE|nr:hypothetical protein CAPTEDRAFT_222892 [Capitella teleta]|eukprot:ELU02955.1 hypothetical protein CAPTEDRAFT_222892 [Capitella teleta]